MSEFLMPSLGASMESGTLIEWLRKPGDAVKRGDVIAVIETDKGAIEVEVFASGVLERLLVEPQQTVPVGTPMAIIREEGAAGAEPPAPPPEPTPAPTPTPTPAPPSPPVAAVPAPTPAPPREARPPRASPRARRRALELGVDLAKLNATGVISVEDVERAAAAATGDARARMRRAIAAAMSLANREIPHFYLGNAVDLGAATAWLKTYNEARPPDERLLPVALLLKASALALRQVPELNAHWTGNDAPPIAEVRLGVAINLRGGGLVAPPIPGADAKSLPALMAEFRDLVARARAGHLRASEIAGGTVTVTSLGDRGAEQVLPIIFPPQVAMVGFGRIVDRPWAVDGQVAVRPVVQTTVAVDHRVIDGHRAGLFLAAVEALLQEPSKL